MRSSVSHNQAVLARAKEASAVALCGTQPPGALDLYERIAFGLRVNRTPIVLLDGHKQAHTTPPYPTLTPP